MNGTPEIDPGLQRLGERVVDEIGLPRLEGGRATRQRARFVATVDASRTFWSPVRTALLGGVLGGVAVAAVGLLLARGGTDPLTVEGARVGAWIDLAPDAPATTARFSDGSRLDVAPGTRARIDRLEGREATIVVARGQVLSEVTPGRGNRWRFEAGTYEVRVIGTKLAVAFDPESGRLMVPVWRGRVAVTRGGTGDRVWEVGPGEQLIADPDGVHLERLRRAEPLGAELPPPAPAVAEPPDPDQAPAAGPSAPSGAPGARSTEQRPAPTGEPRSADWTTLARRGEHDAALARLDDPARRRIVARGDADTLLLLGDAARLGGDPGLARQALTALTERHGDSNAGRAALFRLGRLAMGQGRSAEADRWLAAYVRAAPEGRFAEQARGRRLEIARNRGDVLGARRLAREVLRHHPTGAYRRLADAVLADSGEDDR